jgi:hypothetical protein
MGDACGQVRRAGDRLDAPVLVQQAPGLGEGSPHRGAAGAEQVREGLSLDAVPAGEPIAPLTLAGAFRSQPGPAGAGLD